MAKKRKVLVCGATGFIGRNVAEMLADNPEFEVYGTYFKSKPYKYSSLKLIKADLTKHDDVEKVTKGMDIIIQAAATTSGAKDIINKPYYHVTDNAVMNSLIFRAAYDQNVKHLVFFSCTVMYPSSNDPLKETDFDANKQLYPSYFGVGWTKVYLEKMSEFYSRLGRTKYTVFRHSNIYGPYDKYDLERSHVFGATITKVMTAKDAGEIVVWGTGEEKRDLLYVSDLIRAVELSLSKQVSNFELLNIGLGKAISIADLTKMIIRISGKNVTLKFDTSKPSLKTSLCLNTEKAKKLIGWSPEVSLEEGINKTIQWYKEEK